MRLLDSLQDEANGFASLIRRVCPTPAVSCLHATQSTVDIEEWLSGSSLPELFNMVNGLNIEFQKQISTEDTLSPPDTL